MLLTQITFLAMNPTLPALILLLATKVALAAVPAADDRVKIDNEHARVLVVASEPGAKSQLHDHKINRVMVYLDPGKMNLTEPSGKVQRLKFKGGQALWSPATGLHVSENLSKKPVRIVEIELKSDPKTAAAPSSSPLDWVKVDPKRYRVELENDQVRVIRARYAPHAKGVMHEHPFDYVVVFLTDCDLRVTRADGQGGTATLKAGDVIAGRASKHVEENLSDKPLEVLVVEFKK